MQLFRSLNMPDWLIRCAKGDIVPPEFTYDIPCNLGYGFPPAVLPIWSNSAGPYYIGVLYHLFGNRKTTFIEYHTDTKQCIEVARTPDQLRIWMVFGLLCNVPDFEEVTAFANATGLCLPSELNAFFAEYDDEEDLAQHPLFRNDLVPGKKLVSFVFEISRIRSL